MSLIASVGRKIHVLDILPLSAHLAGTMIRIDLAGTGIALDGDQISQVLIQYYIFLLFLKLVTKDVYTLL